MITLRSRMETTITVDKNSSSFAALAIPTAFVRYIETTALVDITPSFRAQREISFLQMHEISRCARNDSAMSYRDRSFYVAKLERTYAPCSVGAPRALAQDDIDKSRAGTLACTPVPRPGVL